jgi:hypothetical protein
MWVDDDEAWIVLADRLRQLVEVETVRPELHRDRHSARGTHHVDGTEISRLFQHHTVAGREQMARDDIHALLPTRRDDNVVGARRNRLKAEKRQQRLAQLFTSGWWIVAEEIVGAPREQLAQAPRESTGVGQLDRGVVAGERDDARCARKLEQAAADPAGID